MAASTSEPVGFTLPTEASLLVFVGKQRSGKSYAIKSLMSQYQKSQPFEFGVVFTRTKFNHAYDYVSDKRVYEDFSVEKLMKYIEGLRTINERKKKEKKVMGPNFIIFDDLMGVIDWYDKRLINWIGTFRHTNTTIFLAIQYLAQGTSTVVRECTNAAFMFNTSNLDSQKHLYIFYGQQMPGTKVVDKFEIFQKTMKAITESENEEDDHQCLLFQANKKTPEKSYCAWKADPVADDFKMKFMSTT